MKQKSANIIINNFFIFFLLLLTNCSKYSNNTSDATIPLITEAKSYMSVLVKDEKSILDLPYSQLPANSNFRKFARIGKLEGTAKWDDAKSYYKNGIDYSIIPVDEQKNYPNSPAIESVRYLVFSKVNGEKIQMKILEIYSNENTTLGNNIESVVRTSVENMLFNESNKISGISASVIFYNSYYHTVESYSLNNGSWLTTNVTCRNTYKKPSIISTTATLTTNSTGSVISSQSNNSIISLKSGQNNCTTYYLVLYSYDLETGEILSAKIIRTEIECTENPNGEACSGESDNPNVNNNNNEPSIKNNIKDPCPASILNNNEDCFKEFITSALFDKSAKTYFSFNSSNSLADNVSGSLRPNTHFDSDGNPHYEIDINSNQVSNYSNEYIFTTFLHEALHAVIKNNGNLPNENFWHHSAMALRYHDLAAQTLLSVFPQLKNDAEALAWEGLTESLAWKEKTPEEQKKIIDIIESYRNHKTTGKGTGCK